jgi:hypothetical protein
VAQVYTIDAQLICTDGTLIDKARGGITSFWRPFIAGGKKGVYKTVSLVVHDDIAYEICDYHFATRSVRPYIEEGHYLAVWQWKHDPVQGNEWRIARQAFCSSDRLLLMLAGASPESPAHEQTA